MKYPSINQVIFSMSRTIRLLAMLTSAYLVGKFCWWIVNPLGYHTLDASTAVASANKPDGVAQGIVNRAPFGVITVEKKEQPSIVSQIKVTGVYAGGANNSIAFLLIAGKNSIAALGDDVLGAKLKSITPTGIILTLNNQDIPINMSSGSGDSNSNTPNSPPPYSAPSQVAHVQANSSANNAPNQANSNISSTPPPDNSGSDGDSLAEKRRKMIEAFQHQNQDQNANNNQPNN